MTVGAGCVAPRAKFSSAKINSAQFEAVDPLDRLLRSRAKLSIPQVVDAVVTNTTLAAFDATQVDIVEIRTDLDADKNVIWKVDVRTRGKDAKEWGSVGTFEVDDKTGTLRLREGGALELLKALEPYFSK
jgi:hypothetical protein